MVNVLSANNPPISPESVRQPAECPPDNELPENSKDNLDAKLDHAIEETFPTSDPVSVNITKGMAIDYDQQENPTASSRQSREEQDTAGNLLGRVQGKLGDVAERVSGLAHGAYDQSQRSIRRAGDRYPDAQRLYQQGSRAASDRVMEHP